MRDIPWCNISDRAEQTKISFLFERNHCAKAFAFNSYALSAPPSAPGEWSFLALVANKILRTGPFNVGMKRSRSLPSFMRCQESAS
jgi:hypothetical protein